MRNELEAEVKKAKPFSILIDSNNETAAIRQNFINVVPSKKNAAIILFHFDYNKDFTLHLNQFKFDKKKIQHFQ